MKKFLIPIFLTALILCACSTATPPATPTPVPATETFIPATATATETATAVATIEALQSTNTAIVGDTSSVSFANQVLPILNTYCVECHGGQRTREGLNMTAYTGLISGSDNGTVLIAGNANESLFIELIQQGEMPNRGPAPTSAEIQILIDWVNQGALNN